MRQDQQSIASTPMDNAIFFKFPECGIIKYVTADGGTYILDVEDENEAAELKAKLRDIIKKNLPRECWMLDYVNNVDEEFQIKMGRETRYLKVRDCSIYKINNRYLAVTEKNIYKIYVENNEEMFVKMFGKIENCA
jgi:hypothetical protein